MGWASTYIARLQQDETVQFRPRGRSMQGRVEDGALVTVEPVGTRSLAAGDVVLCTVKGQQYLHLIHATQGLRYQIGNNKGGINGWVGLRQIYGVLVKVEP